jgi:hypothetical protein
MSNRLRILLNVRWRLFWSVIFLAVALSNSCNTIPEPEIPTPTDPVSPTPLSVQELGIRSHTVEGWSTFINEIYHYAFDYPNSAVIEVMDKDTNTIRIQTGIGETFLLNARAEYQPGDVTYFLDTASIGQRQIGNFIWLEYVLPDGYCDGSECSPPIYGLQMEHSDTLYRITIYSLETTTEIQDAILATFRIIP